MDETVKIAAFLDETTFDDLPAAAVDHAKRMMIDTTGVALAAVNAPAVGIVNAQGNGPTAEMQRLIEEDETERTIGARRIGMPGYTTPSHAALVNGVMAHALDFDDMHRRMKGHPSATVLPTVMALGEYEGASGREVIRAFVLGVELEALLGDVMHPGHYERGWHPTATFGHIGAAAAAGVLLGLSRSEYCRALGIAASQAGGIKENFGTMTKPYHAGRAARCGIEAARLAGNGYTASETPLEADFGGFCDLFAGDPTYDFGDRVDELGDFWRFLNPPAVFKPYPCCGSPHAAMDCVATLRERHELDPTAIESLTVSQHPRRFPHTDRPDPSTGDEAKFSVQYVVARMLVDGDVWFDDFTDDAVDDPRVRQVMELVELDGDERAFENALFGASVRIVTDDGTEYEHTLEQPNPVDDEKLRQKYRRCAKLVLDDNDAIDRSLAAFDDLDTLDSVDVLVDTFVP